MYTLTRKLPLKPLLVTQAPAIAVSLLIAELFYKFHSFTLECCAFLATWYVLDVALSHFLPASGTTIEDAKTIDDAKTAMKSDKTGTNPINFTHDLRVYNEFQWLNTSSGDGDQNVTTLEFRTPFSNGDWQFRIRGRVQSLDIDGTAADVSDSGFGDFDFRLLTVPYVNMEKKFALAVGFETFLPTATEDSLGSGALSFGPQVFPVFFAPFGITGTLIAPAYQHKFSIDEDEGRDDFHQGLIDVFFLWISSNKQYWSLLDPQILLDYENHTEFMLLDLEAGMMLDKYFGTKGHSAYVRPSVGIGADRPTDGSIEMGYKIIW